MKSHHQEVMKYFFIALSDNYDENRLFLIEGCFYFIDLRPHLIECSCPVKKQKNKKRNWLAKQVIVALL